MLSDRHAKHETHGPSTLIGAFHWTISFALFPNDQNSQIHNIHKFAIFTNPQYSQIYNTLSFSNFRFLESSSISQLHVSSIFFVFINLRNSKHAHIQHFTIFINFAIPQHHKNHKFTKFTNAGFHNIQDCHKLTNKHIYFEKCIKRTNLRKHTITLFTKSQNHIIAIPNIPQYPQIPLFTIFTITHTTLSKPIISRIHATRNSNIFTKSQNSKHAQIHIYITFINFTKPHFYNITTSTVLRILQIHEFAIFRIFRN